VGDTRRLYLLSLQRTCHAGLRLFRYRSHQQHRYHVGPYSILSSNTANVTEPNHVIDQGFTYKVKDWWRIMLDFATRDSPWIGQGAFRVAGDVISSGDAFDQ